MRRYFKLLFLLIIPHAIYASVTAKVDYKTVELGEMVTYYLDVSGKDIVRPNIQRLCDTDVISTSSQTSVQIVNGNITKSYTLSYKFVPQKSCSIKPIEVEIDGKIELSNAVDITVKPVTGAKDKDFVLTLSTDKKELFVGETFDLLLTFKQRTASQALDSEFIAPELNGFWIKNESKPQQYKEGEYTITKLTYTMAPQRAGKLKITKAQMRIASRSNRADNWGAWIPTIKWKTYFSNELDIDVKALPPGVTLVGDFSIEAKADKKEINSNEPVNVTIEVVGIGNLEDIKSFKPYIDGVGVFDEKIKIEGSLLTQKIAFVSERNFTIPVFSLKYFDTQEKKIKTISSKEIDIKVKNAKVKEELTIKKEDKGGDKVENISAGGFDKVALAVVFVVGILLGMLLMMIKPFKATKKEKSASIKDPKVLLVRLLPYKEDVEVQRIIEVLEDSIYSGSELKLDKKVLKEVLKKYKID